MVDINSKVSKGLLGTKLGMTQVWDENNRLVPVTVIEIAPNVVTQVRTPEKDGYNAVQIALTNAKEKHVSKAMQGHFAKAGKGLFRQLREIRLTAAPEQELGQELTVDMFAAGDTVKVTGKSVGKGYQGRMRRWNFAGSKDSHGCEKVHRNNGSIGNNTLPGRVFKGRKMAGHWGNETVTEMGLTIVDVRLEDNVILVKGSVPGPKNGLVLIRKQ